MHSPTGILDGCKNYTVISHHRQFVGLRSRRISPAHHHLHRSIHISLSSLTTQNISPRVTCSFDGSNSISWRDKRGGGGGEDRVKVKGKDNVWSIDNDMAKSVEEKDRERQRRRRRKGKENKVRKVGKSSKVMVSGAMLMEVETVLQTQEPVIRPAWNTFVSSVSGIWKGVGAVFSPITAEMEPVEMGSNNDYLYDCYTLSRVQAMQSGGKISQIQRKIDWVTLNPYGEKKEDIVGKSSDKGEIKQEDVSSGMKGKSHKRMADHVVPKFESFNFGKSDVMEVDIMGMEPGLVFFEDGSYSRGPVNLPVGDVEESEYYLSPTYKFEQCLVKGCHKRLRIVHTIEFSNGGADIQILRVAAYEEQWVGPANIEEHSEVELDMQPFSQRKRISPSELTGPWKVFEVSATPIYGNEIMAEENNGPPYVYFCLETMKKRSLPEFPAYFGEEEMVDMQDVVVLWLPGGVTAYVDVDKDGILCIGVGWYSDEGVNLVMEREYGMDGKLKEVRWKSEVKRRWSDALPM